MIRTLNIAAPGAPAELAEEYPGTSITGMVVDANNAQAPRFITGCPEGTLVVRPGASVSAIQAASRSFAPCLRMEADAVGVYVERSSKQTAFPNLWIPNNGLAPAPPWAVPWPRLAASLMSDLGDAIAAALPKFVQCPRCEGKGQEVVFMALYKCEICGGATRVPEETAQREIERRDRERKRWL